MRWSILELGGFVKLLICLPSLLPPLTFPVKNLNYISMSTLLSSLSVQQLRKAATLKEKIQSLEKELGRLLGSSAALAAQAGPRKKYKMSKAARARISAGAKARWAKLKGPKASVKPARKARRKMSAAAKARLSAKMKIAWARRKAKKSK
jgi:hypothetical protein